MKKKISVIDPIDGNHTFAMFNEDGTKATANIYKIVSIVKYNKDHFKNLETKKDVIQMLNNWQWCLDFDQSIKSFINHIRDFAEYLEDGAYYYEIANNIELYLNNQ